MFDLTALLVTVAAVFSWVNHRFVRLPHTIGLMVLTLGFSLVLVVIGVAGSELYSPLRQMLQRIDFDYALLHGMLGAMLFAGALHLNINDLLGQRYVVAMLATMGVVISTAIVGTATWVLLRQLGLSIDLAHCFLFGALISPTDPIAVGAILRSSGIPHSLQVKIAGESLFNDGVGVVLFVGLLHVIAGGDVSPAGALTLLAREALGGVAFGVIVGWTAYLMLRSIDSYDVEILITLAVVTGGYALAQALHVSGPLAMVVAGLLVGNHGRRLAMSERTKERLDAFWELADEFLNAILFVMMGIEVIVITFRAGYLVAGAVMIPLILAARWLAVGAPVLALRTRRRFSPHVVKMLTWAGLRGGISVALALSVPHGPERELIVTMTYVVVIFSIVVQGLSVGKVARRLYG